jgi:uncharacterized membrane protein
MITIISSLVCIIFLFLPRVLYALGYDVLRRDHLVGTLAGLGILWFSILGIMVMVYIPLSIIDFLRDKPIDANRIYAMIATIVLIIVVFFGMSKGMILIPGW